MKTYDFICIGGGSAGFNAARLAASYGKKVAVVDGAKQLGGLCILRGCMPSKTLIYAGEIMHHATHAARFGIKVGRVSADMKAMHVRKKRIIADFADYREQALKSGRFDLHQAYATFIDSHTIQLSNGEVLKGKHFLIGTGSKVSVPDIPGLKETKTWTSDEVLDLDFVPKSVIVLGGGIVATELAQFLNRIGSEVTLIQRSTHVLREHAADSAKVIEQAFRDEGIEVITDTKLTSISSGKGGVAVKFEQAGKSSIRRAAHLFNALGREPATDKLGLAAAGVKADDKGQIKINRWQQTSVPHIYAAGDCSGPVEIVHIAIAQAEVATRHAFRRKEAKPVDYSQLLHVVFTDPQLATIGLDEKKLKERGVKYLSASYPFNDHGKSILMEANYGYVRVFAEPKRGRILGAEIVGKDAGELIHCFSTPITMRATVRDMLRAPWYHPTLAEIITYPLEEIAEKLPRRKPAR
ncbi:dihydrolipoyl dehydrogenase family protein [Oleiharenicola lentus]|uniref:dihydrolipoyl dehydrogenase family protein n=1 Tax=Oleiharenicola lentus TaxID=2508720 RepID=UPI003F66386D